jgi:subtilisin family serine protease
MKKKHIIEKILVMTIVSFFIINTGQMATSSYVMVEENKNYEYNQESEYSDLIIMNIPKPNLSPNNDLLLNKIMPNDLFFPDQWALHNTGQTGGLEDADIDAVEAWDIETGSSDIVIAIIDSGIDLTHPDLIENIWVNSDEIPNNGIDDDNNGYIDDYNGYDYTYEDENYDPLDHNGHGTVMSGVIAAMTNNEIGISGITWNCKIMPVKVVDADWRPQGNSILDGIRYAADNGAKVICMAFAMFQSSSLRNTIDYAHDKGALLVCSAGNFDNDKKTYPAAYENVIAVAGTDHNDQRMEDIYEANGIWVNSSYGDWVDIAAPGLDIHTTSPTYHVTLCDTWGYELNYDILSGTTLAAPVVAGVAALIFSKNPDYSPDKVMAILKANSDPYDSEYYLGVGRINAYKTLMELNSKPEKPDAPMGSNSGNVGEYYNYTVSSVDVDNDDIYFMFDWDDGNFSDWLGPYVSNEECVASNNWTEEGEYEIRVKARDDFGLESEWSDPLVITMPKSYHSFLELFIQFIESHPIINRILQFLI